MNVLVISVHPDDETLGCGGTLLRHAAHGDTLHWLIATEAHEPEWDRVTIDKKADEVRSVAEAYGMFSVKKLGRPAAKLDAIPQCELIRDIARVVEDAKPSHVYIVHGGDIHSDHRAVFNAAMSVFKPFYMKKFCTTKILCFETLSSTEAASGVSADRFTPNIYIDISDYLDKKQSIMNLYRSEIQSDLLPRGTSSIEALARHRGATIGVKYAEAFMLIREIL